MQVRCTYIPPSSTPCVCTVPAWRRADAPSDWLRHGYFWPCLTFVRVVPPRVKETWRGCAPLRQRGRRDGPSYIMATKVSIVLYATCTSKPSHRQWDWDCGLPAPPHAGIPEEAGSRLRSAQRSGAPGNPLEAADYCGARHVPSVRTRDNTVHGKSILDENGQQCCLQPSIMVSRPDLRA